MSDAEAPKSKRKWARGLAIGCGVYLWIMIAMGIYKAVTAPDNESAPTQEVVMPDQPAPPTIRDSVVVVPEEQVPMASPEPVVEEVREVRQTVVYTTKTGDHYHRGSCSSLRRSKYATTLSSAQDAGLEPCHRCHPPQ